MTKFRKLSNMHSAHNKIEWMKSMWQQQTCSAWSQLGTPDNYSEEVNFLSSAVPA